MDVKKPKQTRRTKLDSKKLITGGVSLYVKPHGALNPKIRNKSEEHQERQEPPGVLSALRALHMSVATTVDLTHLALPPTGS
jgi:hypothetical protein